MYFKGLHYEYLLTTRQKKNKVTKVFNKTISTDTKIIKEQILKIIQPELFQNSGETKSSTYDKSIYLLQRFKCSCTHFQVSNVSVNPQKSTSLSM